MSLPMPEIVQGDARNLHMIPDESVDLIVTSPPYFGLRDYGTAAQLGAEATPAEFIAALIACTAEMVRVLKPSGSIFVNLGDKYAGAPSGPQGKSGARADREQAATYAKARAQQRKVRHSIPPKSLMLLPERYRIACVDELGLIARAVIVWAKPNGLPESVTDRVRRSHEDWVHLTKAPRYYSAVDEIREQYAPSSLAAYAKGGLVASYGDARHPSKQNRNVRAGEGAEWRGNPLGKMPGSVWEIATQPLRVPAELGVDHFAAFPMEWPRRLILGWCPVGGTVLDPFGGTGTTALVAAMQGRRGISLDLSADYCRLAQWRASDPKERARAAGLDPDAVAKVAQPPTNQPDLFDLDEESA